MALPKAVQSVVNSKYFGAVVAVLISWFLISRMGGTSEQKFYVGGQALGAALACMILAGAVSLAFVRLRSHVIVAGIWVMAAVGGFLAFTDENVRSLVPSRVRAAAASSEYVTNKYVTDWMSRSRVMCVNRDEIKKDCEAVQHVVAATDRSVDVVIYGYVEGTKITIPERYEATSRGLCWRIPTREDFAVTFYAATNNVARIEPADRVVPVTDRAEMVRFIYGQLGMQPGDEICSRYSVHDRSDTGVRALKEHVWKNGSAAADLSGDIYHFYNEDARLPLRAAE